MHCHYFTIQQQPEVVVLILHKMPQGLNCTTAEPKYRLCLIGTDGTATAEFILFGRVARSMELSPFMGSKAIFQNVCLCLLVVVITVTPQGPQWSDDDQGTPQKKARRRL